MGLLGTLFKVAKKVGKAGLSVATKGASDKVFAVLKGVGAQRQAKKRSKYLTNAMTAQIAKVAPANVRITDRVARSVLEDVAEGGTYGSKARQRKRRPAKGYRTALRAARAPRKAKRATGKGRAAPRGGLDLKAISRAYKAAGGKDGTGVSWRDFIKANTHLRKG